MTMLKAHLVLNPPLHRAGAARSDFGNCKSSRGDFDAESHCPAPVGDRQR